MKVVEVTQDGAVSTIWINRPEKRNAIDKETVLQLRAAFEEFDRSPQRVAIIAGRGEKAFCSGADLGNPPGEIWHCVPTLGIKTRKPVIAAVHGACIAGGLLFPIFADLCVASRSAKFSYPDGRLGLSGGIVAALAGRVPHKAAMEMIYLGRTVSAERAYEMGLVNEVVEDGDHVNAALRMAQEMAEMAPLVLSTIKSFVNDGVLAKSPAERMIEAQRDLAVIAGSADFKEGRAAFVEKRKATFLGR